jgi:alpha-tubulin suppressor-like RCC1 family protein
LIDSSNLNAGEKFTEIALGGSHSCAITSEGNTYCWGYDAFGQLGDAGTNTDQNKPVLIDSSNLNAGEKFTEITLGGSHSCAITSEGNTYCWGADSYGQLGDAGTNTNQNKPALIDSSNLNAGEKFTEIALGSSHSCGITSEGNTYCWGVDGSGRLGDAGTNTSQSKPVLIDSSNLNAGEKFTEITLGSSHSCGVTSEGNTYCWGWDAYGQLGDAGTNTDQNKPVLIDSSNLNAGEKFTEIALGGFHSCAITSEGNTYCWGYDAFGQLGDAGTNTDQNKPVLISSANLSPVKKFKYISSGSNHSCGIDSEGSTYCWGYGADGRLGDGGTSNRYLPVAIDQSLMALNEKFISLTAGGDHTCGITNIGAAYCWGQDVYNQLGNGASVTDVLSADLVDTTRFATGERFKSISAGNRSTCAISSLGDSYCWGSDTNGRLGNGGTSIDEDSPQIIDYTYLAPGEKFTKIEVGAVHACGLSSLGEIYCWGEDSFFYKQLGNGATTGNQQSPVPVDKSELAINENFVDVSVYGFHSCALSNFGNTFCWGNGTNGQLGDNSIGRDKPYPIDTSNLSQGEKLIEIDLGYYHTCAISSFGNAYCWGRNDFGQAGDGANTDVLIPTLVDISNLATGERFVSLKGGGFHSCGISNLGNTWCWGRDNGGSFSGQLGDGSPLLDANMPTSIVDESNFQ